MNLQHVSSLSHAPTILQVIDIPIQQTHSPWVEFVDYTFKTYNSEEPGRETGQPSQRQYRNCDEGAEAGRVIEYPFITAIVWLRDGSGRHHVIK